MQEAQKSKQETMCCWNLVSCVNWVLFCLSDAPQVEADTDACPRTKGDRHYEEEQIQTIIRCPTGLGRDKY